MLEHELELREDHIPVSTSGSPMPDNFPAGKVEYLAQGIIVGEAGLVLGDLTKLAVEPFNDIRPCLKNSAALYYFKKIAI